MNKIYDIAIIGAGPGGLNAALYASRSNLKVALIEKSAPGGKMTKTSKIENWLGFDLIDGFDLSLKAYNHAISFGAEHLFGDIAKLEKNDDNLFELTYKTGEKLLAHKVIIATGMFEREPKWIENYDKFAFKGISFCATCDGPLFKGQDVIVLGGGNSAVEESTFLAKIVNHVYLIVREKDFIAEARLVEELKAMPNVTIYMEHQIKSLLGENGIEKAIIFENSSQKETILNVSGFFPFIGFIPNNDFFKDLGITNKNGFVETDENMQTKIKGLYAVGDIREKKIRQIVTAAADGAIAAKHIVDNLHN
ncbi:Thioredoxin reductase [Mycoplasmopsis meleagridis]|uniref:Thioredoxin reductase n=1 Tax=Mycoplasmopsis meleagridis ATCC 25294 TaxID=1264554 RepID=A0A0F5H0F0_9BACT|nr:FAD-dependent oxidoreductase [Mycoplasmopsis meleagridis]KKB26759.1 Thioredoxin reductase [Mycoplasmopsis meleagridis ATCC 25294]OAD18125.1 Thioredoxin reductase [Mycoplasmopsis meleagridis]OAD18428.1 Thioredoxin reductase [Mycoplasmopsis meleagridis]VEU77293.1 thioredoxin reductase [Mycoplasmopsis meleagridis]